MICQPAKNRRQFPTVPPAWSLTTNLFVCLPLHLSVSAELFLFSLSAKISLPGYPQQICFSQVRDVGCKVRSVLRFFSVLHIHLPNHLFCSCSGYKARALPLRPRFNPLLDAPLTESCKWIQKKFLWCPLVAQLFQFTVKETLLILSHQTIFWCGDASHHRKKKKSN